jgi:predicted oxidoreductase
MFQFDPVAYEYPNTPAWILIDEQFRRTYPVSFLQSSDADPAWLVKGATLADLAELAQIDPLGLEAEVESFNRNAARGIDPAFHRGESAYDLYVGDHSLVGSARTLRPLGQGPFYAVRVELGAFGTKGGPLTTADAQVVDLDERPIPGLYAVGNTAAHVFGAAYPGAGATLGPALTFGYVAGHEIVAAG